MMNDAQTQNMSFKDRKGWLFIFGVIEILIGLIAVFLMSMMLFMLRILPSSSKETIPLLDKSTLAMVVPLYGGMAIYFIWIGIGSIIARRWARAIMLSVSTFWFIMGIWFYIILCIGKFGTKSGVQNITEQVRTNIFSFWDFFMFTLLVILPAIFFFFYRSPNVKATCERKDPVLRWTDKFPLSVLTVLLLLASSAISYLLSIFTSQHIVTFLSMIFTGLPAMVITMAKVSIYIYLALQIYNMRMIGWTATLIYSIIDYGSQALSFLLIDEQQFLTAAGYSASQIQQMQQTGKAWGNPLMSLMWAGMLLIWIGYLLYIKKYFIKNVAQNI
jgi:hypothetical protein